MAKENLKGTRHDLIAATSEELQISGAEARRVVDAVIQAMMKTVSEKGSLSLVGFGSFKTVEVPAKKGKIPGTDREYESPAHKRVKFKPGKRFAEMVNG